jgi:APA family basic amino acid/polyamine antiporter
MGTHAPEGLPRVITFWDSAALVVGLIIGSGIFRAPASVAEYLPGATLMMAAWLVGGVLSLAGGLAAAELGIRFPRSGGQFVFLHESFGPAAAFAFGWTLVLISRPSILAGIATVFAIYCSGLLGLPTELHKPLAIGAIALLTGVNCLGVKAGTRTQDVLTVAKAAGLVFLSAGVFLAGHGDWGHFTAVPPAGSAVTHSLPVALALGLVTILYTYDGWMDVTYAGGEVINPQRVLPRAIALGTFACTGLYLLVNAAYIYVLDPSGMRGIENVAAVALQQSFGSAGAGLIDVLVVISTLGILNGSILTGVRVPYAMSRGGMLFAALGRVSSRTQSPVNALIAQGVFSCLIALGASGFDEIASLFVDTTWLFYAVSCAGLLVIRRRDRAAARAARPTAAQSPPSAAAEAAPAGQRIPFAGIAAWLFIVVTLLIIGTDLMFSGPRVLVGVGFVALAIPVYYLWRALRG